MRALTLFTLILSSFGLSARAATWLAVETTTTATLRVETSLPARSGYQTTTYLKAYMDLPAGTKLRYVTANATRDSYLYDTSSGNLAWSTLGWVRTILIDSIPGNPLSATELRAVNQAKLYISSSLAATFKRTDGGSNSELIPSQGQYNTSACYSSLVNSGVPSTPLTNLFNFYNSNQSKIDEKRYLAMSDYSGTSKRERFYMIDLANCSVKKEIVAHGSGKFSSGGVTKAWGDPEHDGMLNRCIYNNNRQNMTRPGFALLKGYHYSSQSWPVVDSSGAKGIKMYELGRAKDENFNLAGRGVVMHEQYYVDNSTPGRSYGCPAMKPGHLKPKTSIFKRGVLYYSYAPQCGNY